MRRKRHRTTQGEAKLVALEVRLGDVRLIGGEAVGIGIAVADVLEDAAVQMVGPGFRREGDDASAGAPPFGLIGRGEHLELLDRIDLRDGGDRVVVVHGRVCPAVEQAFGGRQLPAVDAEGVGVGFALVVVAGFAVVGGYALGKVHQLQRIPDVQRCVRDELALDHVAALGRSRLEFRRRRLDRNFLRLRHRPQREVDGLFAADLELDSLHADVGERRRCRIQGIGAGRQRRQKKVSCGVALDRRLFARGVAGDDHLHPLHRGAGAVDNVTVDGAALRHRERRERKQQDEQPAAHAQPGKPPATSGGRCLVLVCHVRSLARSRRATAVSRGNRG